MLILDYVADRFFKILLHDKLSEKKELPQLNAVLCIKYLSFIP